MTDWSARLTTLQALIASIETGGNVELEAFGRKWKKADLATLYKQEQRLIALVGRNNGQGGARFRYGSPR